MCARVRRDIQTHTDVQTFVSQVSRCPVVHSGLGSMSENAASSDTLITANPNKQAVVNKIVEFLSSQMESDPEYEIHTTDIMDVFKNEFSDSAKQNAFREGLATLEGTLRGMGLQPEGQPITVVPQGVVKTFFANPMQLGYRPEDALKGASM